MAKEQFEKENGVEPTVSELSQIMAISLYETAQLLCVLHPVKSLTTENDDEKQMDIPTEVICPCGIPAEIPIPYICL